MVGSFDNDYWSEDSLVNEPIGSGLVGSGRSGLLGNPLADPLGIGSMGLPGKPLSSDGLEGSGIGFNDEPFFHDPWGHGDGFVETGPPGTDMMMGDSLVEPDMDIIGESGSLAHGDVPPEPASPAGTQAGHRGTLHDYMAISREEHSRDMGLHFELMEEHIYIEEYHARKDEYRLEGMLDGLEESIEGSEVRPFYPVFDEEPEGHPEQEGKRRIFPESGAINPMQGERKGRPWIEKPPRLWRPRGPTMPRSRKLRLKTERYSRRKGKQSESAIECPIVRQVISPEECHGCQHENIDKWLKDPGKHDRCTHPDYWAFITELIYGQPEEEGSG